MYFESRFCHVDRYGGVEIDLKQIGIQYRITNWESGLEVFCYNRNEWKECDDLDQWGFSVSDYEYSHPLATLIDSLPKAAVNLCGDFDYYTLGLFRLACNVPESLDLLEDVPALAWLLPECRQVYSLSWIDLRKICTLKRRDILQCFFGNGSKSLVKTLRRMKRIRTQFDYFLIRSVASDPKKHKAFMLTPDVDSRSADYLMKCPDVLGYTWFRNSFNINDIASSSINIRHCQRLVRDIRELGVELGIKDAEQAIACCPDFDHLYRLHERWIIKLNSRRIIPQGGTKLGTPPIEGTKNIIPITTSYGLRMEGKIMHHCVGGAVQRVLNRLSYIYRVEKPQRGTLEIKIHGTTGEKFFIGEFRLYANANPSDEAWATVYDWFNRAQKKTAQSQG